MIGLRVDLDGEGAWSDLSGEDVETGALLERVGLLSRGMRSGQPSVALLVRRADGSALFVETSAALFVSAARAIAVRLEE